VQYLRYRYQVIIVSAIRDIRIHFPNIHRAVIGTYDAAEFNVFYDVAYLQGRRECLLNRFI
jgi:hypothetical protein